MQMAVNCQQQKTSTRKTIEENPNWVNSNTEKIIL